MQTPRTERAARALLDAPLIAWPRRIGRYTDVERQEIARILDSIAVRAARAAAYISRVRTAGHTRKGKPGPSTHAAAVTAQNRTARQVRRALGYTYPDQPINF